MRKLFGPLVGVVALSLVLAACGSPVEPFAATVASTTISSATLSASMKAIADDPGYRCEILGGTSGSSPLPIEGTGASTYSAAFAADVLNELIQYAGARLAVAKLHLAEGPYARSVASSELAASLAASSSSGCSATGATILKDFPADFRSELARFEVDDDVLSAHLAGLTLSASGISSYESSHPALSTLDCVSVIEVSSKSAATTAASAISGGQSFASVAKADSTDSSAANGGALGCFFPSAFSAPLNATVANLAIGQVSAPVTFGSSHLLLEVTRHEQASPAQALPEIFNSVQAKVSALIAKTTAHVVTVDPRFGTWKHSSSGWVVTSASGPADALLPSPSAVTPAAASLSPSPS